MYKIVSSRGGGRTTTLCEYAINNYVNIITPNDGRCAIGIVHNKLKNVDNYTLIVTADHETGGINYTGQTKEQIDNSLFTKTGHTSADVKYYIDWKLKYAIANQTPQKIDNTKNAVKM